MRGSIEFPTPHSLGPGRRTVRGDYINGTNTAGMDRQKLIAIFFAFLMAMWLVATAATLL